MLEWCPEALAVSFLVADLVDRNVVDIYYPADIMAEHPQIVEAHQAAYDEGAAKTASSWSASTSPPGALAPGPRRHRPYRRSRKGMVRAQVQPYL